MDGHKKTFRQQNVFLGKFLRRRDRDDPWFASGSTKNISDPISGLCDSYYLPQNPTYCQDRCSDRDAKIYEGTAKVTKREVKLTHKRPVSVLNGCTMVS